MNTTSHIATPWRRSVKPEQDREYLAFIRTQPCCLCGSWRGIEAAHFGPRGLSQKAPGRQSLPLCRWDHQRSPKSYHKLGPVKFAAAHKADVEALILDYNSLYVAESLKPRKPISRVRLKPADLMEEACEYERLR